MAERQTVAQVQQIGREATPGLAVAATKRLGSLSLSPGISTETGMFRPSGLKFATVQALNQEWVEGDAEGQPTYDEVVYPLAGALGQPVTSQIMDAAVPTGAYQHVFTPDSSAADNPFTFTLEQGQEGVQGEQFSHILFTGFSLDISRSEVSLSGSFIGKKAVRNFDLTNGLTVPADLKPILPGHFSAYVADTAAELDTGTKLLRLISASPEVTDRYNPAWFVNAEEESFTTWTENADGPTAESGMTLEADAVGMSYLDRLRSGETFFLRLEALGAEIMEGVPESRYRFTWDMAVKAREVDTWSDEDGIWAIPFTFQMVHDGTWGKATQVTVVNELQTL